MFTDLVLGRPNSTWLDDVFADFDMIMKSPKFSFDDAFPPISVYFNKDNNGIYYEIALTGYKKEWLKISIDGLKLIIKADVPEEKEDSKKYVKRRIKATSFEKTYKIPEGYDVEKASVSYEDGLLSIEIPIKEKEETSRILEIN